MGDAAESGPTYEDLCRVPSHLVAEIVGGDLYTQPRPGSIHARAASRLELVLGGPFELGTGGPGGWIILFEPELHLGADVLVPDLGGWRRETMPELPEVAYFEQRPDWACEVASPSTSGHDRVRKLPVYAREGVPHVWIVDPGPQTLEVYRLDGETYRLVGTHGGAAKVRAEPFEAAEIDLALLWAR